MIYRSTPYLATLIATLLLGGFVQGFFDTHPTVDSSEDGRTWNASFPRPCASPLGSPLECDPSAFLLLDRCGESSFDGPSVGIYSCPNGNGINSSFLSPSGDCELLSIVFYEARGSTISCLSFAIDPETVSRLIVAIVIYPFDSKSLRWLSHIFKEQMGAGNPTLAH